MNNTGQLDFEEQCRLAAMSAEERFRLHHESVQLEAQSKRTQSAPLQSTSVTLPVTPTRAVASAPAFQDKVRKNAVALAVHAECHTSGRRGGYIVSGRDETTELLFHAFTAARHPNTVYHVRNRYEIKVTAKLDDAEEELLYWLLMAGNRLVIDDEKIVMVKPSQILEKRGLVKCSKNREDAKASLRKLFEATIFVKDLKTGWEDGIRLIRRIRVNDSRQMNKLFDVVLSDDLLALFDEPSFPLMLENRSRLKTKDAANIATMLQFSKDFKKGAAVAYTKEELINNARCYRLAQYSPVKIVAKIIEDLAAIGILCWYSGKYETFTFRKRQSG